MTNSQSTVTWRWSVGLLFGAMITAGGWLYTGLKDRADAAMRRADDAQLVAQENAIAIRGLIEVTKGTHEVRDQLVMRFETTAEQYTDDLKSIRSIQDETRRELAAIDRRLTRVEASLNH